MSISVTCPHCGATLKAPQERAGKRAKCPGCSQKLEIPAPAADPFAFHPSEPETKADAPASGKYRPGTSGRGGVKLAIYAVIAGACVLLAVGGYVLWVRFGPQPEAAKTPATLPSEPSRKPETKETGDKSVPLETKPEKKAARNTGPSLPPVPSGEKLVAEARAAVTLPAPIEKVHTLLVGSAGSMGVVLHRTYDGYNGRGAVDTCERFAIPSGVAAGKMEIPADGIPPGRVAALAPDGSRLAAERSPGTLAIWHLDEKTLESEVVPFPVADGKPLPLVACYYLNGDRVLCVGPRGHVTVYDAAKKVKVAEAGSPVEKFDRETLVPGKSLTLTGDGRTLVMVLGGKVYEIAAGTGKVISSAVALPKGATVRAVAADPSGARILLAFTDDTGGRVALFPTGSDQAKVAAYFPDALGDPASAEWFGNDCVLLTGSKGDGFVVFDAEVGKWVMFVRTPSQPAPRVRSSDRTYHFVPAGEGKTKLVGVEWPFDDYFKDRDFAGNTKTIVGYVLTEAGLRK